MLTDPKQASKRELAQYGREVQEQYSFGNLSNALTEEQKCDKVIRSFELEQARRRRGEVAFLSLTDINQPENCREVAFLLVIHP